MWSDPVPATLAALVWLVLDLALFFAVAKGLGQRELGQRELGQRELGQRELGQQKLGQQKLGQQKLGQLPYPLLFVTGIALFVRLVPAVLLPVGAGYDIESFGLVGHALLSGEEVYTAVRGRHPYLPMQMFSIGGAFWAAQHSAVPFVVWLKLPAVLADGAITAMIFKGVMRWRLGLASAVGLALLFALNPVSLLITAYHGQFDALPVLLLLLAWWGWEQRQVNGSAVGSAAALGLAILSKTWPIIFWPIVLMRQTTWRAKLTYTAVMLAIPVSAVLLYLLVFDAQPEPMLRRALTHTGVAGYWGVSAVVGLLAPFSSFATLLYDSLILLRHLLLIGAILPVLWLTRRQSALDALLTTLLAIFAVSVGIGIQWLVWIIPFGLLALEKRWSVWYAVAVLPMLLAQLYGLHLYPFGIQILGAETATIWIKLASLPGWLVVVGWLFARVKRGTAGGIPAQL